MPTARRSAASSISRSNAPSIMSPGKPSELVPMPADLAEREATERTHMLEQLADHDDKLLEQLLMDVSPCPRRDLRRSGARDQRQSGRVGAVRIGHPRLGHPPPAEGAAPRSPGPAATCYRLGVEATSFYAFKVSYGGTVGRLVLGRVLGGAIEEGSEMRGADKQPVRFGSLFAVQGDKTTKVTAAGNGAIVARRQGRRPQGRPMGVARRPAARRSSSTSRRATPASRSSPPTARTTSSCRARWRGVVEEDPQPGDRAGRDEPRIAPQGGQ